MAVSPTRSAHLRSRTAPACPTKPLPLAVTVRLWSHPLRLLTRRAPPFYYGYDLKAITSLQAGCALPASGPVLGDHS